MRHMNTVNFSKQEARLKRSLVFFLLVAQMFFLAACDLLPQDSEEEVARYGDTGRRFALDFVRQFPFRAAGSAEEAAAADFLMTEAEKFGYAVSRETFTYTDLQGGQRQSQNIVVSIPGQGLQLAPVSEQDALTHSHNFVPPAHPESLFVLVGAHYDTKYSREEAQREDQSLTEAATDETGNPINTNRENQPRWEDTDGIDDNGAAVASLMTLLRTFREAPPLMDVRLVFFGAGHQQYAGAGAYAEALSETDRENLYCMVNLDSVYAGDKVYAHAGQNSVLGGREKNYRLRQCLYVCTDIYYNNLLLTNNGFALFTNQSNTVKDVAGVGKVVYREWTEHESDHTPFDRLGLPVVFFESANYDVEDDQPSIPESADPYFSASEGMIAGTYFDSSELLTAYFVPAIAEGTTPYFPNGQRETETMASDDIPYAKKTDVLEIRINNLAFIIGELCREKPYGTEKVES